MGWWVKAVAIHLLLPVVNCLPLFIYGSKSLNSGVNLSWVVDQTTHAVTFNVTYDVVGQSPTFVAVGFRPTGRKETLADLVLGWVMQNGTNPGVEVEVWDAYSNNFPAVPAARDSLYHSDENLYNIHGTVQGSRGLLTWTRLLDTGDPYDFPIGLGFQYVVSARSTFSSWPTSNGVQYSTEILSLVDYCGSTCTTWEDCAQGGSCATCTAGICTKTPPGCLQYCTVPGDCSDDCPLCVENRCKSRGECGDFCGLADHCVGPYCTTCDVAHRCITGCGGGCTSDQECADGQHNCGHCWPQSGHLEVCGLPNCCYADNCGAYCNATLPCSRYNSTCNHCSTSGYCVSQNCTSEPCTTNSDCGTGCGCVAGRCEGSGYCGASCHSNAECEDAICTRCTADNATTPKCSKGVPCGHGCLGDRDCDQSGGCRYCNTSTHVCTSQLLDDVVPVLTPSTMNSPAVHKSHTTRMHLLEDEGTTQRTPPSLRGLPPHMKGNATFGPLAVEWEVNTVQASISFHVSYTSRCGTTWVGLALSSSQTMGGDAMWAYIAVNKTNNATLYELSDRIIMWYALPSLDVAAGGTDNFYGRKAEYRPGDKSCHLWWSRQLDTGDREDRPITLDWQYVLYAQGSMGVPGSPPNQPERHFTRGAVYHSFGDYCGATCTNSTECMKGGKCTLCDSKSHTCVEAGPDRCGVPCSVGCSKECPSCINGFCQGQGKCGDFCLDTCGATCGMCLKNRCVSGCNGGCASDGDCTEGGCDRCLQPTGLQQGCGVAKCCYANNCGGSCNGTLPCSRFNSTCNTCNRAGFCIAPKCGGYCYFQDDCEVQGNNCTLCHQHECRQGCEGTCTDNAGCKSPLGEGVCGCVNGKCAGYGYCNATCAGNNDCRDAGCSRCNVGAEGAPSCAPGYPCGHGCLSDTDCDQTGSCPVCPGDKQVCSPK